MGTVSPAPFPAKKYGPANKTTKALNQRTVTKMLYKEAEGNLNDRCGGDTAKRDYRASPSRLGRMWESTAPRSFMF
ncbi:hypothetical protein SKAU_G00030310 [Synaphobranchus kaupii]|uniref:Uncharacterized protein n=1 Tax=Synaphobranchus kaupii TaxID=118154 RepID=A0A9Q1GEK5_SYNKA|nr:hypothetical protein SKAU_G00030310 [Synaphobranchus kaupii]